MPMRIVASPAQHLQDGRHELINGTFQPPVERPERYERILAALIAAGFGPAEPPADQGLGPILRVHDADYVGFLQGAWDLWVAAHGPYDALPLNWVGRGMRHVRPTTIDGLLSYHSFDAGTPLGAGSWAAAKGAADAAVAGADILAGGERAAFALCRPPGHHAAADYLGGYCFLNNAAIAAQRLRDGGAPRVAVLDVDYHHGNGTQSIFWERGDVLFVSIHCDPKEEFPFFIGHAEETGAGAGEGANLNLPLPRGTRWPAYAEALGRGCAAIAAFGPDALVVSLGVDTYEADPISHFHLTPSAFPRIGEAIAALGRPTLFVMEGGYDLATLGENVAAVLGGFEGRG